VPNRLKESKGNLVGIEICKLIINAKNFFEPVRNLQNCGCKPGMVGHSVITGTQQVEAGAF
jgi:hypothetical protein